MKASSVRVGVNAGEPAVRAGWVVDRLVVAAGGRSRWVFLLPSSVLPNLFISSRFHVALSLTIASRSEKLEEEALAILESLDRDDDKKS